MPLYSEMTPEELKEEMKELQKLGQRAYDMENWSDYEIHMTKWYLAKSYEMLPTAKIEIGRTYRIADDYDRLTVTGLEGAMAWGVRESTAESVSIPLARLDEFDDGFDWETNKE
jgi:hypothetical protein